MTDSITLRKTNEQRWRNARLTRDFSTIAKRLIAPAARSRYEAVSARTGVPWPVIAVIHERECSQDWGGSLAQGDPWDRISVHVPAGRGPFKSWEDAAVDALVNCAPYAGRNNEWSIGATLTKLEEYNGLGYAARQQPSPYIWSGTDQYRSGKYVRDGVYDPAAVDHQLGCAGLLIAMTALDPGISFDKGASVAKPAQPSKAAPPAKSVQPAVAKAAGSPLRAFFASLITIIFGRK
jgi:lysozyme family protein